MLTATQNNLKTGDVYSVSGINTLIKGLLDNCNELKNVKVRGEVSNFKLYPSGHRYFSIKDNDSVLSCVMFKYQGATLKFTPENGMGVIVYGTISEYVRDGKYQLICDRIEPDGVGALQEAFEKLKQKLSAEGLFDVSAKTKLPPFPKKIALVTSPSGAAVRDMIRILKTRWPLTSVVVVPVTVQGATSAQEISEAIELINAEKLADLIVTGRGGGSIEDLWSFNEEVVARAIYASEIPVISAVGHEPDVTISDYVADRRASTPSNAAEIAVPDMRDTLLSLEEKRQILYKSLEARLTRYRNTLSSVSSKEIFINPARRLQYMRQDLDHIALKLSHALEIKLNRSASELSRLKTAVTALNPYNTLERGFSVAMVDNKVISAVKDLSCGASIKLIMSDGSAECTVNTINIGGAEDGKR